MARWKFRSQAESRPMGIAGRLFLSLFFLFFLGIGSIVVAFIGREAYQSARTWFWESVEAEVVSSGIREEDRDSNPYVVEIEYTYEFNGQRHTGTRFKPGGEAAFSDYGRAQRLRDAHAAGARVTAYVNSAAPSQAVLKRGQLWLIPLVLFPMIFVVIGAGGIWFAWRWAGKAVPPGRQVVESISERARSPGGGCFLIGFFSFFLLIGGVVFVFMFVRPVLGILDARNWVETPCVVESSQVRSHSSDDGTTYSVDILYRYEVNGREYKSNRYHFMGGSSSGWGAKRAIVREHPPGRETVCYVNPRDSTEAVLERGFTHDLWFGLIPLVFVGVGAGGLLWGVRKLRAGPAAVPGARGWVQS
ncbi:MAG TPA: DUF3592 domain-containing protein, partial [Methylomirabilota bacterium]|nr:DUF3592 domain-containing protein [Methylomirabilota bacterium]